MNKTKIYFIIILFSLILAAEEEKQNCTIIELDEEKSIELNDNKCVATKTSNNGYIVYQIEIPEAKNLSENNINYAIGKDNIDKDKSFQKIDYIVEEDNYRGDQRYLMYTVSIKVEEGDYGITKFTGVGWKDTVYIKPTLSTNKYITFILILFSLAVIAMIIIIIYIIAKCCF